MTKIAFIGAGSVVFAKELLFDIFSCPAFSDATISLMDIDPKRLGIIEKVANKLVAQENFSAKIEAVQDRRKAVKNADFVISMFQAAMMQGTECDINIPLKYGVKQAVGDTLGPGGVFRLLRSAKVLEGLVRDMEELCPDALLINYVNPMAMNCWYVSRISDVKCVGLCHSVQHTSQWLALMLGAPLSEISYRVAGINHMAWFLEFKWNGKDAYPLIREKPANEMLYNCDVTKFEMLKYFGYFVTESSHHLSEYLPYFRKSDAWIERIHKHANWNKSGVYNGMYLEQCKEALVYFDEEMKRLLGDAKLEVKRGDEYGSYIMNSIVTGAPSVIYGNVINRGFITNLPDGCCVEVPCLVDKNGIQPTFAGDLPIQLAALNRTNINVQELAVEGAVTGRKEPIFQAVAMDPLTSAVLTLPEIYDMVGEMFEAEKQWLPNMI